MCFVTTPSKLDAMKVLNSLSKPSSYLSKVEIIECTCNPEKFLHYIINSKPSFAIYDAVDRFQYFILKLEVNEKNHLRKNGFAKDMTLTLCNGVKTVLIDNWDER